MNASLKHYGGIETGGTKTICIAGTSAHDVRVKERIPTTTPHETISKIIDFFERYQKKEKLSAIGIASFGPIDLNQSSSTFGCITNTPKVLWAGTNLAGIIRDTLGLPVAIDTDVNSAALGEYKWGAAAGLDTFIYLTIGTGIGGGGLINGQLIHGVMHPEMGHMRIPHDFNLDPFKGTCPFHGDCWEGLASGESIKKRWGKLPESIPSDHPAWILEANYIATGIANLICTLSPQRIIVGGGILKTPGLLPEVRQGVKNVLNNYLNYPEILEDIDHYIVSPGLGDMSGVLGAMALAQNIK